MKISQQLLKTAGILAFGFALFQLVLAFSPDWSRAFGAGEDLINNKWLFYVLSVIVIFLFTVCGFYAFSGLGKIRRLPLLRTALVTITILLTVRGISVISELLIYYGVVKTKFDVPVQYLFASGYFLVMGILYLVGIVGSWRLLPKNSTQNN